MYCTDIVDEFYNKIAVSYQKYIGETLKEVINDLSKTHIVKPYKIKNLQNNDVVIWKSKGDNMAHVTVYKNNKFYYSSKTGVKIHPVLMRYKGLLIPKNIIRLKETI